MEPDHRNQNEQDHGTETPGDTDAPDIVGRTGEEMPEVAHDEGTTRAPGPQTKKGEATTP